MDLVAMMKEAESVVQSAAVGKPGQRRMGTTLTVAYLIGQHLFAAQVGDSRCYLLRDSVLHHVTTDDTVTQQLSDEGKTGPKDAEAWGFGNVLTEAIGGKEQGVYPLVHTAAVAEGDTILLCTDGLTRHVPESEIADILTTEGPAAAQCENLIAAANDAGGSDNITVVVGRVLGKTDA
jgi:protein phosphatase